MIFKCPTSFRIILIAALLLMLPIGLSACGKAPQGNGPAKPSNDPTGKIASSPLTVLSIVGGDVLIIKPGEKEWIQGEAGMTLGVDYKIKTEANGHATLTFFEGSTIELKGDTEIGLAELVMSETTNTIKVKQTLGDTISKVKKLTDPASRYEIETPAAVAAVRGSIMYVSVAQDGKTNIGNIEGLISAIAQGIEVKIPVNTHVTIAPGYPPQQPQSGATVETLVITPTTSTPSQTVTTQTVTTTSTTSITTPTVPATISVSSSINQQKIFGGDIIIFTYTVANTSAVPVSDITVMNDKAGPAKYDNGDENKNSMLDPNESWSFKGNLIIPNGVSGLVPITITASGKGPNRQSVSSSISTEITVLALSIQITSPNETTILGNTITLAGNINDTTITQIMVTQNGVQKNVSVANGSFSTTMTLVSGMNTITVTATRYTGVSATITLELVPVTSKT